MGWASSGSCQAAAGLLRGPGESASEAALHGDRAGFLEAEKIWLERQRQKMADGHRNFAERFQPGLARLRSAAVHSCEFASIRGWVPRAFDINTNSGYDPACSNWAR